MSAKAPVCTACELHAESTFKVEGMDCREEVAIIERRFKNLPGVEAFSADVLGQRLHVKYDAAKLSASAIAAAVADAGMRAWLEHEEPLIADGTDRSVSTRTTSVVPLFVGLHAIADASDNARVSTNVTRVGRRINLPPSGTARCRDSHRPRRASRQRCR